jgi:serine/threonine-protein kinase RsbW
MKQLELKADLNNFEALMEFINSQLVNSGIDDYDKNKIMTACDEIIINIIKYAYPNHDGKLEIIFDINSQRIVIVFIDSGKKFNPLEKPDTDISLSLEERKTGGLGILMVKSLMDNVNYEYKDDKNRLTIVKYIPHKYENKEE